MRWVVAAVELKRRPVPVNENKVVDCAFSLARFDDKSRRFAVAQGLDRLPIVFHAGYPPVSKGPKQAA
jgi:hypothetical protein